jgi:hypothetical protein
MTHLLAFDVPTWQELEPHPQSIPTPFYKAMLTMNDKKTPSYMSCGVFCYLPLIHDIYSTAIHRCFQYL